MASALYLIKRSSRSFFKWDQTLTLCTVNVSKALLKRTSSCLIVNVKTRLILVFVGLVFSALSAAAFAASIIFRANGDVDGFGSGGEGGSVSVFGIAYF